MFVCLFGCESVTTALAGEFPPGDTNLFRTFKAQEAKRFFPIKTDKSRDINNVSTVGKKHQILTFKKPEPENV